MTSEQDQNIEKLRSCNQEGLEEPVRSFPDINSYIKCKQSFLIPHTKRSYQTLLHMACWMKDAVYLFHLLVTMGADWRLPILDERKKPIRDSLGLVASNAGNTDLIVQLLQGKIQYGNDVRELPGVCVGMNSIVRTTVTRDLIDHLDTKNLLKKYITCAGDVNVLRNIWKDFSSGQTTKDDCEYIFKVLSRFCNSGNATVHKYFHRALDDLIRTACHDFRPGDTILFDLIQNFSIIKRHPVGEYLCDKVGKHYCIIDREYLCDKFSKCEGEEELLCYLDLCQILAQRGYLFTHDMIASPLYFMSATPLVSEKVSRVIGSSKDSEGKDVIEFDTVAKPIIDVLISCTQREKIGEVQAGCFGVLNPVYHYQIMVDHVERINSKLLEGWKKANSPPSGPVRQEDLKMLLASIPEEVWQHYETYMISVQPERLRGWILNPETCTSFPDLFEVFTPKYRDRVRVMMYLYTFPDNIVHHLPREILFLILRGML